MGFLIAMFIVAVSCLLVTYRTLASYSNFSLLARIVIFALLFIAWFSPVLLGLCRHWNLLNGTAYAITAKSAYFLMGFAFILVMLLIVRDIIWYIIYLASHNNDLNPDNTALLNRNNLITVIVTLCISVYAVYEANKTPNIKEITITDNKIKEDVRMVVASDLHIDLATPLWQIQNIVNAINAQKPDYVLLVGDIIDDTPQDLKSKMEELKKIKAKKIYLSLGNHELYNSPIKWMIEFTNMGFEVLYNTGMPVGNTGIYIAGVPDDRKEEHNWERMLYGVGDDDYKILMSHAPSIVKQLQQGQFDLQVSGHTHGGQIFPFNFLSKAANDGYLAGLYDVNGTKLYVTRGAGVWGPPMRLLAPSDITVINFRSSDDEK